MPGSKLGKRRGILRRPIVCHPSPPPGKPPGGVTAWMKPPSQDAYAMGLAQGKFYVNHSDHGPEFNLQVAWTAPSGWWPLPEEIANGVETTWDCYVAEELGTFVLKAYVTGADVPPVLLQVEVTVIEEPPP